MELTGNTNLNIIYQRFENDKKELPNVDKNAKSTFENTSSIETSNNKNIQRDEESKKLENMISSSPSLANANEELQKNSNLNKLFLQTLI